MGKFIRHNNSHYFTWLVILTMLFIYTKIYNKCPSSDIEIKLRQELKMKEKVLDQKTKTLKYYKRMREQKKILIISQLYVDREHTEYGTNFFVKKNCPYTNCVITQE